MLKSVSLVGLPLLKTLPSKSSFLILAWVSGFNKSSLICFTLDFSSILSRCKASLIKSWVPTGFLPKGENYDTFKVQISMEDIKYGNWLYQNKAQKPLQHYPHFIEKIAFAKNIYNLHKTQFTVNKDHCVVTAHGGDKQETLWTHYTHGHFNSDKVNLALDSCVQVLASDKAVKGSKQCKRQKSILSATSPLPLPFESGMRSGSAGSPCACCSSVK